MRGRHGAARPPLGVLISQEPADFVLLALQFALAVTIMVFAGYASVLFWLALLGSVLVLVMLVRRIGHLSRAEEPL
ncbi:hypothetical protein [Allonocardiopsis opalescens]|uniref:Uncharacterized protein n=1 Tax=Allonocardiopsis opalescens TaxID=1144618 RepID=A0A2T0QDQ9_9ACTN|nr:hypothetical protein [Allonocardiopsis opalescens]PRY01983.1 hypothetical protein CLV72_101581 [Allonocardiopsis opalescens]